MATSMLGGMTIGMGTSSPIVSGPGLNNLTPQSSVKYHQLSGSSIHSPISNQNTTPNSAITINNNSGSVGKSIENSQNLQNADPFGSKCKRKINFSNLGIPARPHQPATVARRNARERNRVKQVNNGFAALKQHIPVGHRSKKMSKVETLRCAVDYIRNLQGMLNIHSSFSFNVGSPTDSTNSGDILLEDDNLDMDEFEQPQSNQNQLQNVQEINNQREGSFPSSSSTSSSPTSEFNHLAAHLPQIAAHLNSHHLSNQQLQHLGHLGSNRHLSMNQQQLLQHPGHVASSMIGSSNQLSPTSSDGPESPEYSSEGHYQNLKQFVKYDYEEKYEPVSPEDEELLDAIAFWQQS